MAQWEINIDNLVEAEAPRGAYWTADLPRQADDYFASKRRKMVVAQNEDGRWTLKLDGVQIGDAQETAEQGWDIGHDVYDKALKELETGMFAMSGLSPDKWDYTEYGFNLKADPKDTISYTGMGWDPRIGGLDLPRTATAIEAEDAIANTYHVNSKDLEELEQVYEGSRDAIHPESEMGIYLQQYIDQGLVAYFSLENGLVSPVLTEKGRDAVSRDPRGLPLDVRDRIFELGGELSDEDLNFLRLNWNGYIGTQTDYAPTPIMLREALLKGWELTEGSLDTFPHEVCIYATGMDPKENRMREEVVAMFGADFNDDEGTDKLLAAVISQNSEELAQILKGEAPQAGPSM